MTVNDLTPLLKRLKLGQMLPTLPERIALARRDSLDYVAFLEVILSDEVNRRDVKRLRTRLEKAGFEQICSLEDFDWGAEISMDKRLIDAVFALEFLQRAEHVLLVGPVGVGKSFLAQALGYAAVRAGHAVRFARADHFFRDMARARLDATAERTFRSYLAPDLLILRRSGVAAPLPAAVAGPVRAGDRPAPGFKLRDHLQPGGRGVAGIVCRSGAGQQRIGPVGQRQLPDRDRGQKLSAEALAAPAIVGAIGGRQGHLRGRNRPPQRH